MMIQIHTTRPMNRFHAALCGGIALATSCVVSHLAEAQTVTHEVVAATGDAVPGLPSAQYTTLENVTTAPNGRIILQSYMSGPGITSANNRAIWSSAPGGAPSTLAARIGDTGPSSSIYASFNYPRIASGGKVGFLASNGNMAQVSTLLCVAGDPGNLSTVAATTMDLPGTNKKIHTPVMAAVATSGDVLVSALLEGLSDNGLWRGVPGNLTKIAVTGDAAPGLAGITISSAMISNMSGNGTVAFLASLSGDTAFNQSIWRWTPDAMTLIVRKGSTVLSGEVITSLDRPAVNDGGSVVFLATTNSGGRGLWINSPGGVQRLLAEGTPVPGLDGWTFSEFERPSINSGGQIAFEATLKMGATTQRSFWLRDTAGGLHLLGRIGGVLPTRGAPGTVTNLQTDQYALSDDGTAVFIAQIGSNRFLYRARIVTAPPVVRLSSAVFRTSSSKVIVRGTVSSSSAISRVLVRPAAAKQPLTAKGTTAWSARVSVPEGRSKVFVQAIATDGSRSKIVTARVQRTK